MNRLPTVLLAVLLVCFFSGIGNFVAKGLHSLPGLPRDAGNPAYAANNRVRRYFDDSRGRERMDLGMYNGQPIQDFFAEDRTLRLQIGTYTNDVRANEKGLPVLTLYDRKGNLRELLRLDGSNQSPFFILKDHGERNRLIMGLALDDADEEPFLAWFDEDGKKNMLFGKS